MNNILLHVYATFCFSICQLRDTWVASAFWLVVNNAAATVSAQISESLLSILLSVSPEVELLDDTVIIFLIFGGTTIMLSVEAAPFYIPTNCTGVPIFQCPRRCFFFE